MNKKPYIVSFQLWDITKDEKTGDLLRESSDIECAPLTTIDGHLAGFLAKATKFIPPAAEFADVDLNCLRVSMTRNNGDGIQRIRIDAGKRLLRLDVRARRQSDLSVLQECHTRFTTTKRPVVELQHSDGFYWVIVTWTPRADFDPPKEITGTNPLTGTTAKLTLNDTMPGDDKKSQKALYSLDH